MIGECLFSCPDMQFEKDESYDEYMECIGKSLQALKIAIKWVRRMTKGVYL